MLNKIEIELSATANMGDKPNLDTRLHGVWNVGDDGVWTVEDIFLQQHNPTNRVARMAVLSNGKECRYLGCHRLISSLRTYDIVGKDIRVRVTGTEIREYQSKRIVFKVMEITPIN